MSIHFNKTYVLNYYANLLFDDFKDAKGEISPEKISDAIIQKITVAGFAITKIELMAEINKKRARKIDVDKVKVKFQPDMSLDTKQAASAAAPAPSGSLLHLATAPLNSNPQEKLDRELKDLCDKHDTTEQKIAEVIARGANPNAKLDNQLILEWAVQYGNKTAVKALIAANVDINKEVLIKLAHDIAKAEYSEGDTNQEVIFSSLLAAINCDSTLAENLWNTAAEIKDKFPNFKLAILLLQQGVIPKDKEIFATAYPNAFDLYNAFIKAIENPEGATEFNTELVMIKLRDDAKLSTLAANILRFHKNRPIGKEKDPVKYLSFATASSQPQLQSAAAAISTAASDNLNTDDKSLSTDSAAVDTKQQQTIAAVPNAIKLEDLKIAGSTQKFVEQVKEKLNLGAEFKMPSTALTQSATVALKPNEEFNPVIYNAGPKTKRIISITKIKDAKGEKILVDWTIISAGKEISLIGRHSAKVFDKPDMEPIACKATEAPNSKVLEKGEAKLQKNVIDLLVIEYELQEEKHSLTHQQLLVREQKLLAAAQQLQAYESITGYVKQPKTVNSTLSSKSGEGPSSGQASTGSHVLTREQLLAREQHLLAAAQRLQAYDSITGYVKQPKSINSTLIAKSAGGPAVYAEMGAGGSAVDTTKPEDEKGKRYVTGVTHISIGAVVVDTKNMAEQETLAEFARRESAMMQARAKAAYGATCTQRTYDTLQAATRKKGESRLDLMIKTLMSLNLISSRLDRVSIAPVPGDIDNLALKFEDASSATYIEITNAINIKFPGLAFYDGTAILLDITQLEEKFLPIWVKSDQSDEIWGKWNAILNQGFEKNLPLGPNGLPRIRYFLDETSFMELTLLRMFGIQDALKGASGQFYSDNGPLYMDFQLEISEQSAVELCDRANGLAGVKQSDPHWAAKFLAPNYLLRLLPPNHDKCVQVIRIRADFLASNKFLTLFEQTYKGLIYGLSTKADNDFVERVLRGMGLISRYSVSASFEKLPQYLPEIGSIEKFQQALAELQRVLIQKTDANGKKISAAANYLKAIKIAFNNLYDVSTRLWTDPNVSHPLGHNINDIAQLVHIMTQFSSLLDDRYPGLTQISKETIIAEVVIDKETIVTELVIDIEKPSGGVSTLSVFITSSAASGGQPALPSVVPVAANNGLAAAAAQPVQQPQSAAAPAPK